MRGEQAPETVFVYFALPLLPDNLELVQPLLFDSHARPERTCCVSTTSNFERYLAAGPANTVNVDVITLSANLRIKPRRNPDALRREFAALARRVRPWQQPSQPASASALP